MPVAIPANVCREGKAYVGLRCDHCGLMIQRKFYIDDLEAKDHVFCDNDCKRMYRDEHADGKAWNSIYSSMESPKVCQTKIHVARCDECSLKDCAWNEARNILELDKVA